jgi:hypothetical protein
VDLEAGNEGVDDLGDGAIDSAVENGDAGLGKDVEVVNDGEVGNDGNVGNDGDVGSDVDV